VSPDGTKVALSVTTPAGHQLFLRPLDSAVARPVEGAEGGMNPFWSPDGQWLAFFTPTKLKRVHVGGGPAQTIADLGTSWATLGAWGRGDTILVSGARGLAGSADPGPLVSISAWGGQPVPVLRESQGAPLGWPAMLPDGRRFLFLAWGQQGPEVRVGSLDSGETSLVMRAFSRAVYAPPGYLLFVRDSTLMAQRFDLGTLSLSGVPHAVADGLLYFRQLGIADFSASDNGVLVFQAGDTASRLVWYGRDGMEQQQVGPTADYFFMRLSPSGRQIAVDRMDRRGGTTDLALLDVGRGGPPVAMTSDEFVDWSPVFSPDERQVAFASARRGAPHVHLKGLHDSTNGTEMLPPSGSVQFVTDWATGPDGTFLVYNDERPETHGDIFLAPLSGARSPRPLVQTPADEADGRVSPDGQFLAYVSTESGRSEVYVRALRDVTERYQVSAGGAMSPRWRRDGTELYYIAAVSPAPFGANVVPGMLTAVQVHASGRTLRAGTTNPLFAVRARAGQYEPAPDGSRFLVNSGSGIGALPITVVTDWSRDLPR
jgi:Tol biopolymer transport system component